MIADSELLKLGWKDLVELNKSDSQIRERLRFLADANRKLVNPLTIAVTGSNGKSTCKEITGEILKRAYSEKAVFVTPANDNTNTAVMWHLANMAKNIRYGVFEVGARKVGDFDLPFELLLPKIAVLLNIGLAHVGEFGSLEKLRAEKSSVLWCDTLEAAIINGDDDYLYEISRKFKKRKIYFGTESFCTVRIINKKMNEILFDIDGIEAVIRIKQDLPGIEYNFAAAIAICVFLNIPIATITAALNEFDGMPGRFSKHKIKDITVVDDSFNASPESMRAGLQKFFEISKNKSAVLVIGSMLELGESSDIEHERVAETVNGLFAQQISDNKLKVLLVGCETRVVFKKIKTQLNNQCLWYNSVDVLLPQFDELVKGSEFVYLKASKAIKLNSLIKN